MKEYELDPAYFCTTPGLAMEACLKQTNVKLEQLTDIDKVLLFKKGITEGIAQSIQRHASANNKYMPNFSLKQKSTYLLYVDANNLYGWAMTKKLPIDEYLCCDNFKKFTCKFIRNYDNNSDTDYLFEVDIEYPKNLHDSHRDLPFLAIKKDKLLTILEDKENYVVHITALKQALNHGLKLMKLHSAILFRQEAWLKPSMNNAVFGKTMENVRNRRDVKLVVTEETRKKLVSEPNYDSCKQFCEMNE